MEVIKRVFLFPSTSYLKTHWWHRLATVVFWIWIAGIILATLQNLIIEPWEACVSVSLDSRELGIETGLDCRSNAFAYAWRMAAGVSAGDFLIGASVLVALCYLMLIVPSLLYRVVLYVAVGSRWKASA